ncbi:unnamed protein product [Adineta steineri]|uniref:Ion transport domain-containing protein n=1 Tax=Adineta steineri TaxID=433720 RepID=A0A814S6D9_9BILA|nr:unnamed protein product [Adineta steineri]CAF0991829.1 unnamed protein product [Adineta steineri]CAF1086413.1 unnamed protein product [Adineta steineri]CAF1143811.1 unnamed protein product [Adineta steineri]CAF1241172.1 unnamed protein product [Adineta steineri]
MAQRKMQMKRYETYENLIISRNLQRPSQTSLISEQLRNLRRKFSDRTDAIKEIIDQSPDFDHDKGSTSVTVCEELQQKQFPHRSIFSSESISHASTPSLAPEVNGIKQRLQRILLRCIRKSDICKPIDTDSSSHLTWLLFVAMGYLYNFISIPLRIAFPVWKKGETNIWLWMIIDYSCDVLYVIDTYFVQTRIKYLENGLWVTAFRLTAKKYLHSLRFLFDCLSLVPLDFFYFLFGFQAIFRLPRLLKLQSLTDFFRYCDRWVQSFFCYQPRRSAYSYSFYYCFKIASTIGNIPSPETGLEYVFVIIGYLFALFIFALLIGQISDVFQSINQRRSEYQY